MSPQLSRRQTLAGATLTLAAFAGCTDRFGDTDEPDPDISAAELAEIAEGDRPELVRELPVSITDEFIEDGVDRVESLLEEIPEEGADIPNEAVRGLIEDNRERAKERVAELEGEPPAVDALSALRRAREDAASAAGAYEAAVNGRTREEAREEQDELEAQLAERRGFDRVGEEPERALVVYEMVENRLSAIDQDIFDLERLSFSPVASEIEAVERIDGRLERGRASLAEATHLVDQQTEATDGGDLEGTFEDATETLLEAGTERLEALPTDVDTQRAFAEAVFETDVEGTPRETLADPGSRAESNYENALEDLEEGYHARALMAAMRMTIDLLALEWLQEAVDDGRFELPTEAGAVRETREEAVSTIESTIESEEDASYLLEYGVREAIEMVERGDQIAEDGNRHNPPTVTVVAQYAIGTARAQSVPESVSRVEAALSA